VYQLQLHDSVQGWLDVCSRLFVAVLAGWAALVIIELVWLFGVLRLFAMVIGPELLPSLKVVLDMGALTACGWTAGRLGRPRKMAAAVLTAAGLTAFDLTPYIPLNVPWLVRLAANAVGDSRYLSSLLAALVIHALMFGSLIGGAYLSRSPEPPVGLGVHS
jgi:hypothetical protein